MVETKMDYSKVRDVLKGLGAEQGKVVTRFPPEPSGYLHVGHIKASMLNYHYAKMYGGKMILRLDDTNPSNEKADFVDNIMADLQRLDIIPDRVTYSSDYFEQIEALCRKLIKDGNAYADDTPAEEMKEMRDEGIESKYRACTVAENIQRFDDMLAGKTTKFCIRAKLNMQDKVKCLRDPVFYRCKADAHHRTGTKYKAYPTYDLTVPIVDSLEGVTHSLRTIEYRDRNALYVWVQKALELTPSRMYDFSKLQLVSTVLSKRKLKWFVENNVVTGWDDPRFPTVQGIIRKGMTVDALKEFMLDQGPSQNTNLQEWDKIWAINKGYLDPVVPRYTCIGKATACKLFIENGPSPCEARSQPLHPKNASVGTKAVIFGRECWIERDDAATIEVGEKVTLMKWGNVTITKKEQVGDLWTLSGTVDEADKDFKKTKKVTWINADPKTTVDIELVEYGHLITKPKIEATDEIEKIVNPKSKISYTAIAEGCVRQLQKSSKFQFERRGFYVVDQIALVGQQLVCNLIPDGKAKAMSNVGHAIDAKELQKGKGDAPKKGKMETKKADGEDGKMSKKEASKLAKKAAKADMKAAIASGQPLPAKEPPIIPKPMKSSAPKSHYDFVGGEAVDALEKHLGQQQWMNGSAPSQDDVSALQYLAGRRPNPLVHPNLFAWASFATKFPEAITKGWLNGNGLPAAVSGVAPAAPQKKAAAKEESKESKPKKEKKEKAPKAEVVPDADEKMTAFAACDLRVGKIVECVRHANSEKLYVEQVDLGEGRLRTIGSGLQEFVKLEDMTEGLCMVFANLKPRKLADIMSEGMVLCASSDDHKQVELMRPPAGAKVGDRVQLEGNPIDGKALPEAMCAILNPKKKIAEKMLPHLKTNGQCEGSFEGKRLMVAAGVLKC